MHSHLLPGIDDGVQTLEESLLAIQALSGLGYSKLTTTPHIISDLYRNTPEIIRGKLTELQTHLTEQGVHVAIDAAAEYYLDETLMNSLKNNQELLLIGNQYLLFETNFVTEPLNLKEFIFIASTKGYKLILAHPERYLYLHGNIEKLEDLKNRGVLFQLNITSLAGHYSKNAQKMAQQMIDRGWVDWLGTDLHHAAQAPVIRDAMQTKYFRKALDLPLLNYTVK